MIVNKNCMSCGKKSKKEIINVISLQNIENEYNKVYSLSKIFLESEDWEYDIKIVYKRMEKFYKDVFNDDDTIFRDNKKLCMNKQKELQKKLIKKLKDLVRER